MWIEDEAGNLHNLNTAECIELLKEEGKPMIKGLTIYFSRGTFTTLKYSTSEKALSAFSKIKGILGINSQLQSLKESDV